MEVPGWLSGCSFCATGSWELGSVSHGGPVRRGTFCNSLLLTAVQKNTETLALPAPVPGRSPFGTFLAVSRSAEAEERGAGRRQGACAGPPVYGALPRAAAAGGRSARGRSRRRACPQRSRAGCGRSAAWGCEPRVPAGGGRSVPRRLPERGCGGGWGGGGAARRRAQIGKCRRRDFGPGLICAVIFFFFQPLSA